jgi:hypothetical protein
MESPVSPGTGAFAAKLNGVDGSLIWNSFVDPSGGNYADGISVDGQKNTYVSGTKGGAPFIARFTPAGKLNWRETFGSGFGLETGIDRSGAIYINGMSSASWGTPINDYEGGDLDAFVAKYPRPIKAMPWIPLLLP